MLHIDQLLPYRSYVVGTVITSITLPLLRTHHLCIPCAQGEGSPFSQLGGVPANLAHMQPGHVPLSKVSKLKSACKQQG